MMEKETEEEIYKKCFNQVAKEYYGTENLWDDQVYKIAPKVAERYHQERKRIEAPMDELIDKNNWIGEDDKPVAAFKEGAKWMRKLLTGI